MITLSHCLKFTVEMVRIHLIFNGEKKRLLTSNPFVNRWLYIQQYVHSLLRNCTRHCENQTLRPLINTYWVSSTYPDMGIGAGDATESAVLLLS